MDDPLPNKGSSVLNRISRIFRREGLRGFYVRLRHPKQRVSGRFDMPTLKPPFMFVGGTDAQVKRLREAFRLLPGFLVAPDQGYAEHVIRLAPAIAEPAPGTDCTILWSTPEEVKAFCRHGRKARQWLGNAAAVLVPSSACFQHLATLGLSEGRIFVLSPAHAGPGELAGGLARWLIAGRILSPRDIDVTLFPALSGLGPSARLCLSLPEAPWRRNAFLACDLPDFKIFDGIRLSPGWIGCGWSYGTIARAALALDATPLVICEDDIAPPLGFRQKLQRVENYLAGQDWDLFSGLLTDLPETARIDRVTRLDGITFIHLDYATGMVLNIYGPRVLAHLAAWSPEAGPVRTNTIDAWLSELPGLRVITTVPFLVGHDSQARSTLFGFANQRYDSMIRASENRLQRMVEAFERARMR